MFLMHQKDETGKTTFNSPVILYLRDGNVVSWWHIAISVCEDAHINIHVVHQCQ
jgi:hypothetical protein